MAGEGSKRDHVYQHDLLITNQIARREWTEIAKASVIDEKIDIDLLAL